jgi:hypothetical protein
VVDAIAPATFRLTPAQVRAQVEGADWEALFIRS